MPTEQNPAQKTVLDFTNVKEASGINPTHQEPGDYRMTLTKVSQGKSGAGNEQWVFTFVPTNMRSAAYPYYCGHVENQLWKIRNLLIACGKSVPKKRIAVDPNKLVGTVVGVTLEDDEYEGKLKSVISAIFPASDLDDDNAQPDADVETDDEVEDDVEVEETAPTATTVRKKKPAPKAAPEPEEAEEEVTDDDLDELDVEDL